MENHATIRGANLTSATHAKVAVESQPAEPTESMSKFTPEQEAIIANLGAIISGLQVPMSIAPHVLGAAYQPLCDVRGQLRLFGYPKAEEVAAELKKALESHG
jgi:hypothetical protein